MTISLYRETRKFQFEIGLADVAGIETSEDSGFFPRSVDLVFSKYDDDDGWDVEAAVEGPIRLKTGKPGVRTERKVYSGPAATGFHRYTDDDFPGLTGFAAFHNAPQWLHELAAKHSPVPTAPVPPAGWADETTPKDWQPGDRVRVRPAPSNSDPSYWRVPPAGALGYVRDAADSEGDVFVELDEHYDDSTTRRVTRKADTGWVRKADLELYA